MKVIILAAFLGMLETTQGVVLRKSDPVDDPITKDMNALLDKTPFSRSHNKKAD